MLHVNQATDEGDASLLLKALQNPALDLGTIHSNAAQLYLEELTSMKGEKGDQLDFSDIEAALKGISFILKIMVFAILFK